MNQITIRLTLLLLLIPISNIHAQIEKGKLVQGKLIESEITSDENHQYTINLKKDQFVFFKLMQDGIDLKVTTYNTLNEKYNNERLHSSVCNLPPNIFLECWNKGLIEQKRDEIKRRITFKLKIPYNQISGNTSLKCSSLQNLEIPSFWADELNFYKNEMIRPETSLQTSV